MICDEVGGGTEYEECGRELQDERAAGEGNDMQTGSTPLPNLSAMEDTSRVSLVSCPDPSPTTEGGEKKKKKGEERRFLSVPDTVSDPVLG